MRPDDLALSGRPIHADGDSLGMGFDRGHRRSLVDIDALSAQLVLGHFGEFRVVAPEHLGPH